MDSAPHTTIRPGIGIGSAPHRRPNSAKSQNPSHRALNEPRPLDGWMTNPRCDLREKTTVGVAKDPQWHIPECCDTSRALGGRSRSLNGAAPKCAPGEAVVREFCPLSHHGWPQRTGVRTALPPGPRTSRHGRSGCAAGALPRFALPPPPPPTRHQHAPRSAGLSIVFQCKLTTLSTFHRKNCIYSLFTRQLWGRGGGNI